MHKPNALLIGGTLFAVLMLAAHAAGPLTPPGAPGDGSNGGPSLTEVNAAALKGKTLIPAQTATFTISQPGSYVLTGNVVVPNGNGINIQASGVDLDLNGFQIQSTSAVANGNAIDIVALVSQIRIHSGRVLAENAGPNPGFAAGLSSAGVFGLVVEDMSFYTVGVNVVPHPQQQLSLVPVVVRRCSFTRGAAASLAGFGSKVIDCEFAPGSLAAAENIINCSGATNTPALAGDEFVRIPQQFATYTISTPGNYVLTGNITVATGNGIDITTSNVNLDLGGFAVTSTEAIGGGASAIRISNTSSNVRVRNGRILSGGANGAGNVWTPGTGFSTGISLDLTAGSTADGFVFEDLSIKGVNGFAVTVSNVSLPQTIFALVARRLIVDSRHGIYLIHSNSSTFGKLIDCDVRVNSGFHAVAATLVGQSMVKNHGSVNAITATTQFDNHIQ